MDGDQLGQERAKLRDTLANDDGKTSDRERTESLTIFTQLGGAAAENGTVEQAPPKAAGGLFAPADWIGQFEGVPLSTDRAQLRYSLEQGLRDKKGPDFIRDMLRSYIVYLSGQPGREADLERARKIMPFLVGQKRRIDEERALINAAFGRMGTTVARQLLDASDARLDAQLAKYGLSPGAAAATDELDGLSDAAARIAAAQETLEADETRLAEIPWRLRDLFADPNVISGDVNAETSELHLLQETLPEQVATKKAQFMLLKGEFALRHPVLAIADGDKQRYNLPDLKKLARSDTQYLTDELAEVRGNITKVRADWTDDTIWSIPDLVPTVLGAMGASSGSLAHTAVQHQLGLIGAGKVVKAASNLAVNIIAAMLSFTGAGPLIWLLDGVILAKDVYDLSQSIADHRFKKAAKSTDYDQAMAISQQDPSLFWLAFEIVTVGIGAVGAIKSLSDAAKMFKAFKSAKGAAVTVDTVAGVSKQLDEIDTWIKQNGLPGSTGQRLRKETLETIATRSDEIGDEARRLLLAAKANDVAAVGKHADDTVDGADALDDAAEAIKTGKDPATALRATLGDDVYDQVAKHLSPAEIQRAITGLGERGFRRIVLTLERPDGFLALRKLLGWRVLRKLSKHMDGRQLMELTETYVGSELRFLRRLNDSGLDSFAKLDLVGQKQLLDLPEALLVHVTSLPGDAVAAFTRLVKRFDDVGKLTALLAKAPAGSGRAAALRLLAKLDDAALDSLDKLAPEQLAELLKGDPRVLDAIAHSGVDEQSETLKGIADVDEVYTAAGAATTRAGHAGTMHGPHMPASFLFDRAKKLGKEISKWVDWPTLKAATTRAKKLSKDKAYYLATKGTDNCPLNTTGWKKIKAGQFTLDDVLADPAAHKRWLKKKVNIKGSAHPSGKQYDPDGTSINTIDDYVVVLQRDDTGVYHILTAYPGT